MKYALFGLLASLLACSLQTLPQEPAKNPELSMNLDSLPKDSLKRDTVFKPRPDTLVRLMHGKHPVRVGLRYPQNEAPKGSLLLLPGWNYPAADWCEKTDICSLALAQGYALVLAEMEKSIYPKTYYPQTRADWRIYPTRTWLLDSLMPHLQAEHGVLVLGQPNFALGLSTGGRGAVLLGLDLPELFWGIASLSGDFEQNLMPTDKLMEGVYGPKLKFPERWSGEDNPALRPKDWRLPLYLGHGLKDKVVPAQQSKVYYEALQKTKPTYPLVLHLDPQAAHTYAYWGSEVKAVWAFFMAQVEAKTQPQQPEEEPED